jgi:hypothetical protein
VTAPIAFFSKDYRPAVMFYSSRPITGLEKTALSQLYFESEKMVTPQCAKKMPVMNFDKRYD